MLRAIDELPREILADAHETAAKLRDAGVRAVLCGNPQYPERLRRFSGAPPVLYVRGPLELLGVAAVGLCGSRNATVAGLRAARACGRLAAEEGLAVVSGYAKGVDTAGHLSVLEAGGRTVAVLAEGIERFALKKAYREQIAPEGLSNRMLVVSQFAPTQRWSAGAAMTRNQVIVGMSLGLVAVEAGETGGTLTAGETALRGRRPVLVPSSSPDEAPGNKLLVAAGAHSMTDRQELLDQLRRLRGDVAPPGLFEQ
ncbi:DNA-processing protein DprA [Amycolatopsis sp. A133]|uniref:DNA-processing protein DprA n=1 Tax=Amycolatopsis sp. A133 TaxID=3064472 RepID=UPI0027FDDDD7|nr:DNA-processing protein DprA [Amycolatopsis sp. A133]MDQ7802324.1 DNA-processing protein DprA [Amycolatopsis sp. A133]